MKFFLFFLCSIISMMGVAYGGPTVLTALLLAPLALKNKLGSFIPIPLVLPLPLPIPVHHHDDDDHEFHSQSCNHGFSGFANAFGGGSHGGGSSYIHLGSGGTHGSYTHVGHSLGGGHESFGHEENGY